MKNKLRVTIVLIALVVVLGVAVKQERAKRTDIIYAQALDEVALVVDGVELTLRDMAVYVAFQEAKVQKDAIVYDAKNPSKYWNAYTNRYFIRSMAEKAIREMAIHDEIFYRMALAEALELDEREEEYLANEVKDFFMDLSDEQLARLGVGREDIEASMRKIALANKYQSILSQAESLYYEDYEYTGVMYELILAEHEITIIDSVWNRISVGSITVNYQ